MAMLLFGLLWAMRRHPFAKGWLFAVYLLLAGTERLPIEQIRLNPVLNFFLFYATQAEFIAGMFMVLGFVGIALLSRHPRSARLGSVADQQLNRRDLAGITLGGDRD